MSKESATYHTIANVECTGVFCQEIYVAYSYRYNEPEYMRHRIGIVGDYHLFVKHGDKVYMEVKKVGEIVMSFAELQKNKYWKYYYDLSLMLAIDKEIKNEPFNKFYDEAYEYTGNRVWSLDTAYIDLDIDQNANKIYKIIPSGNVCYYKINPADLEKMDYSSQQGIDIFKKIYMCRNDVRSGYFLSRSVIYRNIALEYNVKNMEKELDELSEFFEDKKIVINLVVIQEKHAMNSDVLMILYNTLLSSEGNKKYSKTIDEIDSCKNKLERVAKIMDV
jgi:hypothetical protein